MIWKGDNVKRQGKRWVSLILVFCLTAVTMGGCSCGKQNPPVKKETDEGSVPLTEAGAKKIIGTAGPDGKIIPLKDYVEPDGPSEDPIMDQEQPGVSLGGNGARVVLPGGTFRSADVTIQEVAPPKPYYDTKLKVYDINMASYDSSDGYVEIRLDYSDMGLTDEEAKKNLQGMYFNEATREWEHVLWKLDPEHKEVVIKTDHFSKYAICNMIDIKTPRAVVESADMDAISDLAWESANEFYQAMERVEERFKKKKPTKSMWDAGMTWINNYGTCVDSLAEGYAVGGYLSGAWNKTGAEYVFGQINEFTTYFGLAWSTFVILAGVAKSAYQNGGVVPKKDIVEALKGTAIMATGAVLGVVASPLASVFLGLVPFVDKTLTKVHELLLKPYQESVRRNYYQFYRPLLVEEKVSGRTVVRNTNKYYRDNFWWADWIRENRVETNAMNQKVPVSPEKLRELFEKELDNYVSTYWQSVNMETKKGKTTDDLLDAVDAFDTGKVGGVIGRVANLPSPVQEEIQKKIAEQHKEKIRARMDFIMRRVREKDYDEIEELLIKTYHRINREYNSEVKLKFEPAEGMEDAEKEHLSGATVYLVNKTGKPDENWKVVLDKEGRAEFRFTKLGFLSSEGPERILVFEKGKDPSKDKPYIDMTYKLEKDEQVISLGLTGEYPTLKDLLSSAPKEGIPVQLQILKKHRILQDAAGEKRFDFGPNELKPVDMRLMLEEVRDGSKNNLCITLKPPKPFAALKGIGYYNEKTGKFEGEHKWRNLINNPVNTMEGEMKASFVFAEKSAGEIEVKLDMTNCNNTTYPGPNPPASVDIVTIEGNVRTKLQYNRK